MEVEVEQRDDIYRWGEASRFAIVSSDGEPFGNIFVARAGKTIYFLYLAGVYFDDHEAFDDLVRPALSRLAGYRP